MPNSKPSAELDNLTATVQRNCHVSDALYAGNYTMCVFLLKMREYYRWEQGIALTGELDRESVGDWLVERERTWDRIENEDFEPLPAHDGDSINAFDTNAVNGQLLSKKYVYSSGKGLYNKPHFFIGDLEKRDTIGDITILISGREYARDLVAPPSMYRDKIVFVRKESLRRYLWERIEEWRFHKGKDQHPIGRSLDSYGSRRDLERVLDEMTDNETGSLILHEVGEARAGELLGPKWEEMLATFPRTKFEFQARAVRDLLADSLVTLPALLEQKNDPSLHVYFANLGGMRKHLAPGLGAAYQQWNETGNYAPIYESARQGQEYWLLKALSVLEDYCNRGSDARGDMETMLEQAAI
ncbi:MAG: Sfum_1244 family protein [Acidiferrobacterales bacterium]